MKWIRNPQCLRDLEQNVLLKISLSYTLTMNVKYVLLGLLSANKGFFINF